MTPDGMGTVVDLNILKETVRVRIPKGDGTEQKDYPLADIQRLQPARSVRKAAQDNLPAEETDTDDAPDAVSVAEFAGEEGLTPEEAMAEIAEIAEEVHEELADMEDGGDTDA